MTPTFFQRSDRAVTESRILTLRVALRPNQHHGQRHQRRPELSRNGFSRDEYERQLKLADRAIVTLEAAARRLGISIETFRDWCARYGWGRFISNDEIVDWGSLRQDFSPTG